MEATKGSVEMSVRSLAIDRYGDEVQHGRPDDLILDRRRTSTLRCVAPSHCRCDVKGKVLPLLSRREHSEIVRGPHSRWLFRESPVAPQNE